MELQERQLILTQLATSESRLLTLLNNLSPDQWSFRETPTRWSIAENLEHLILFEDFIRNVITNATQSPGEPTRKQHTAAKERLVQRLATSRNTKLSAREVVRPTNKWTNPTDMIPEFQKTRAQTIAFATATQFDLRNHFFPHVAFGDLDCYQWLLVMAQHTSRHAFQIEEIKSHPAYPASST